MYQHYYTNNRIILSSEIDKHWDELPQTFITGLDWIDIVQKVKTVLKEQNSTEARISTSKGYDNQGYYINNY